MTYQDDRTAFAEFAGVHGPALHRVALALTADPAGARSLLRTALSRTARRWRRTADPYEFAVAAIYRRYLRRSYQPALLTSLDGRRPGEQIAQANRRVVHAALRHLAPDHRAVLVARLLERRGQAYAAELLGGEGDLVAAIAQVRSLCEGTGVPVPETDEGLAAAVAEDLHELADSVAAPDVTAAAVASARRSRLARRGVVAAAGTAAALAVVVAAVGLLLPDAAGDPAPDEVAGGPPSPQLAGQRVVTSYVTSLDGRLARMVLNPDTGDYHADPQWLEATISPDLRMLAAVEPDGLVLTPTTGEAPRAVPLAGIDPGLAPPVWSPDSRRLALAVPRDTDPSWPQFHDVRAVDNGAVHNAKRPFDRILVVDVAEDDAVEVLSLDLPEGQVGAFGGAPRWHDHEHLAVPTTTLHAEPDRIVATDTVSIFDLEGGLVRQAPLHLEPPDPDEWPRPFGHGLHLAAVTPDGDFLFTGVLDARTIEVAVLTLASHGTEQLTRRLSFGEPPERAAWTVTVQGWLSEHEVLLEATTVPVPYADGGVPKIASIGEPERSRQVYDLDTGRLRRPTELALDPEGATRITIGGAEWLAPAQAGLAF